MVLRILSTLMVLRIFSTLMVLNIFSTHCDHKVLNPTLPSWDLKGGPLNCEPSMLPLNHNCVSGFIAPVAYKVPTGEKISMQLFLCLFLLLANFSFFTLRPFF